MEIPSRVRRRRLEKATKKKNRKNFGFFLSALRVLPQGKTAGRAPRATLDFHVAPILREATTCFCQHWIFSKKICRIFLSMHCFLKPGLPFSKKTAPRRKKHKKKTAARPKKLRPSRLPFKFLKSLLKAIKQRLYAFTAAASSAFSSSFLFLKYSATSMEISMKLST